MKVESVSKGRERIGWMIFFFGDLYSGCICAWSPSSPFSASKLEKSIRPQSSVSAHELDH